MIENSPNIFDAQGLAQLQFNSKNPDKETLRAVAAQFEALFLQMALKSMRDANKVFESELFNDSGQDLYHELYDQQLTLTLANRGGVGLTDILEKQLDKFSSLRGVLLARRSNPENYHEKTGLLREYARNDEDKYTRNDEVNKIHKKTFFETFGTPEAFVIGLWDHAKKAANLLGLDPKVLIAQAALETGWGKKIMHDQAGKNSYNLFGMKAAGGWKGEILSKTTLEFDGSGMHKQIERFRSYNDFSESFADYAKFVHQKRYEEARRSSHDPVKYVNGLQKAGYATDPDYAKKIMSIYHGDLLNKILAFKGLQ